MLRLCAAERANFSLSPRKRAGVRVPASLFPKCIPNCFQDRFRLLQDLAIPKSQFANALTGYFLCPCFVVTPTFTGIVLTAIQLNRKFRVVAVEIENKAAKRMLTAKFEIAEASTTYDRP